MDAQIQDTSHPPITLIEIVMIVVIVGMLSAMAVPRFESLHSDARQAAVDDLAGALASAAARNYEARSHGARHALAIANCTDVGRVLAGGLDPGYAIADAAIPADASATCSVRRADDAAVSASFVARGVD